MQEVFDYYNAHPELKALIRFGINLGTMINQRDAEPLGLTNMFEAQYGYEGLERIAPLKSIMENGIQFHIEGTEPHADRGFPTWYIQKAVTREDAQGRVIAPQEALDRKTAFLALTRWGARFLDAHDEYGSIQEGMMADLVIFNGNLLDVPIAEITNLKPVFTMVGGRIAYEEEGL